MLYSECQATFECVFYQHFQSVNVVHFFTCNQQFSGRAKKKQTGI